MIPGDAAWLETHTASKQYFYLPREYAQALGNLRWSDQTNCLTLAGEQVASYEELALFLEGFVSQRPILAFGSIAHWLVLLTIACDDVAFTRLRAAFRDAGRCWRNAGALAGMISESLLPATDRHAVEIVCARLRDQAFPIRWFSGAFNGLPGEEPAHSLIEFEHRVREGLFHLSDADLTMWLKSGRGPVNRAGEELARVQPTPRTVGSVIDELLNRPRLAGAASYLPQMIVALSVPPRRQLPEQLPVGGYSDVVTHGGLDQILPSQYALDEVEFLRRFCDNELFYFRREEPPARLRQELIIILDQGVRTWGDVRLVLTAAALALAKLADRKALAQSLALTSRPGIFQNPYEHATPELCESLAASDFTRDPGLVLEDVLKSPTAVSRDVFLLTHPLNLAEDNVRAAARRLAPQDRLFGLTVNNQGDAEFVQIRHGMPVRLRSCRVDFVRAATQATQPSNAPAAPAWSGAVEPIGWPIPFGIDSRICWFDFCFHGKRILAITRRSMIYVWNLTNGDIEVLPLPQTALGPIWEWHGVKGVSGGFALLGTRESHYAIAHYDMVKRTCAVYDTPVSASSPVGLAYVRHCHSIVLLHPSSGEPLVALDLAVGTSASELSEQRFVGAPRFLINVGSEVQDVGTADQKAGRAARAISDVDQFGHRWGMVYESRSLNEFNLDAVNIACYFVKPDATLLINDHGKRWQPITPYRDGKKLFSKKPRAVQLAENTLVVDHVLAGQHPFQVQEVLTLYRGPDGHFLREISWTGISTNPNSLTASFVLSADGNKIALLRAPEQLEVQYTERPERILITRARDYGATSRLWVGNDGLLLRCGRKGHVWHLVLWSGAQLQVDSEVCRSSSPLAPESFQNPRLRDFISQQQPMEAARPPSGDLANQQRWVGEVQRGGARFVLDRFGQVVVFDRNAQVIFHFFAHGDSWSACLPDGTRHGLGSVHSRPNTPGALAKMSQVLRHALERRQP
jgi:hypothetical protein